MTEEIYALDVEHETDVFASRQAARDVAAAIGVEGQDLVRVATALSEVTRDLLASGGGRVTFWSPDERPADRRRPVATRTGGRRERSRGRPPADGPTGR